MTTISILIPIHNRLGTTKKGLSALEQALANHSNFGSGLFIFNTIVIDDGSTDGSFEWIKENYADIILLKGDGSLWWTGSINLGAKYALEQLNSDYILLWNDDIVPAGDFFLVAENTMFNIDKNTIMGAKIIDTIDSARVLSCGGYFNKFSGIETIINNKSINKYTGKRFIEVDSLTGMGTFIPQTAIKKIGFWDTKLPHYKSDSDYTLTLKEHGYKILVDQNLIIMDDASQRGITKPGSIAEFFGNLKSIKSPYNLKYLTRYKRKHGIVPFSYYGIVIEILPVLLGVIKRRIKTIFIKH